ncbi:MAG: EAL domain-containing response regulator [Pseudomonadota bacterium]
MSKLVVIDDERSFGDFVGRVAAAAGYEATVTNTAGEFRRAVEKEAPSVIVMDLQMPETDGFELLRELGDSHNKANMIIVSGAVDSRTMETARRLGKELGLTMAGILEKPVRALDLQSLLAGLNGSAKAITPDSLRAAIANDRLFLAYQPKIDLRTKRLAGVEALVRWRDESGKTIYPDAFIPLAERHNLIDDLTLWVVDRAFRQGGQWRAKGLDLKIAVNISAKNIHDHNLPDLLEAKCREADLPSNSVTLELTETASMQNATMLLEVLGRFRVKGFNLSIDDFGTGYSSVVQLVRLPFSELKVDKSFVMEMDRVKDSAIVAKTIIDMGHNLGLSVVAEGVEKESALKMLCEYGCDFAQGRYFFMPMDAGRVEAHAALFAKGGP